MVRYWVIALVAVIPLAAGVTQAGGKTKDELNVKDKLTKDDPRDKRRNAASKVHVVKLKAGTKYTIDMVSSEFDSYLFLEDSKGKQLDEDDDSGGNLNARIIFDCTKDGDYKIVCTAFSPEGVGNFTLTVKKSGTAAKNTSVHEALVGKSAPDFQADFALNGQAVKLADLKGKVILLDFWDVKSNPSAAALPRLREWHQKYKGEGLEIVGISYYNSDLGQKYSFDKETGKVANADKGNRESDQPLLKAYAEHHKMEFLLLTLAKEEALRVFDAYSVNGIPQVVLIDRNGMVRTVRFGDEKDASIVENEIKKLLAEK